MCFTSSCARGLMSDRRCNRTVCGSGSLLRVCMSQLGSPSHVLITSCQATVGVIMLWFFVCVLFAHFSLSSLFYGEPSEKEKSPSESSPSDSETKDMVSSEFSTSSWKHQGTHHLFSYQLKLPNWTPQRQDFFVYIQLVTLTVSLRSNKDVERIHYLIKSKTINWHPTLQLPSALWCGGFVPSFSSLFWSFFWLSN